MTNETHNIVIVKDFSEFPAGRYPEDGSGNGTDFREKFLVPVLESGDRANIVLDGAPGYPSSFLEEAFGGLVRKGFDKNLILSTFNFIANQPRLSRFIDVIRGHIDDA